jgi:hypothetical protein
MSRVPRKHERVNAVIPVELEDGAEGITRDLSPAGVYFVTGGNLRSGEAIRFTLEFDNPAGKLYLDCVGEVVRVEDSGGKMGVAVRITESRLERRESMNADETSSSAA